MWLHHPRCTSTPGQLGRLPHDGSLPRAVPKAGQRRKGCTGIRAPQRPMELVYPFRSPPGTPCQAHAFYPTAQLSLAGCSSSCPSGITLACAVPTRCLLFSVSFSLSTSAPSGHFPDEIWGAMLPMGPLLPQFPSLSSTGFIALADSTHHCHSVRVKFLTKNKEDKGLVREML